MSKKILKQKHKKQQDIVIVGAGTAGLYSAYLIKKKLPKSNVIILEDHNDLKKTCSGILTHTIYKHIKVPEEIILRKVYSAKIYAPDNNHLDIRFKNPDIIVDRQTFNNYLAQIAKKEGCRILLNTRFENIGYDVSKNATIIAASTAGNDKNKKSRPETIKIHADMLIGADGALSSVAKAAGLWTKREFYIGFKAKAKLDISEISFYPHIKDFAWISPMEKGYAEIGIARKIRPGQERLESEMDAFIKKLESQLQKQIKIIDKKSAVIPEFKKVPVHEKIKNLDIYLVGDSACQVKATTLGGIIPNMRAAEILARAISEGASYNAGLRRLNLELYMHKKARKIFSKFAEKEWNELIKDFNDPKLSRILSEESRDMPIKMATRMLKEKPSLLKYSRYLFS